MKNLLCIPITLLTIACFGFVAKDNSKDPYFAPSSSDLLLLTGVDFRKKVKPKFILGANIQMRRYHNMRNLQAGLLEFSGKYNFTQALSATTAVRYGRIEVLDWHGWGTFKNRVRFMTAVAYKFQKADFPFSVQTRLRYEREQWGNLRSSYSVFRPKIRFSIKVSQFISSYIAAETFMIIRKPNYVGLNRYEAGINWKVSRANQLRTFYRLEAMKSDSFGNINMIGLVWNLNWGVKKQHP